MFYVYALCDQAGEPFYIGKGRNGRMHEHARNARRGMVSHTCNKIRKIWHDGGEISAKVLWANLNEDDAFFHERLAIATLGRENLTNLCEGGGGTSNPSEETRRLLRESNQRRTHDEEARAKISLSNRRRTLSQATREKIAQAQRGRTISEETRAKMSESASKPRRPHSEETRAKIAAAHTGRRLSDETRMKMSESRKRYLAERGDPN